MRIFAVKKLLISFWVLAVIFVSGITAQESATTKLEDPPWLKNIASKRLLYSLPGMERIKAQKNVTYKTVAGDELKADVYAPPKVRARELRPAIVFIHGGALPPNLLTKPKEWGVFESYGQLAAASGFIGVTFNHRYYGYNYLDAAQADVNDLIVYIRGNAEQFGIDKERIFIWAFSGGGVFLSHALRDAPTYIRGIIAYYAVLDLRSLRKTIPAAISDKTLEDFSPLFYLTGKNIAPLFVARAGQDNPNLNKSLDEFVREATAKNLNVDFSNHAAGQHAFDTLNDDARTREIIKRTLEFIKNHS